MVQIDEKLNDKKLHIRLHCPKDCHSVQYNHRNHHYFPSSSVLTQPVSHQFQIGSVYEHSCHQHSPKLFVFPVQGNSSVVFLSNGLQRVQPWTYIKFNGERPYKSLKFSDRLRHYTYLEYIRIQSHQSKIDYIPPTANKAAYDTHPKIF